jgi:DNA/RNA-binding domain of Phe-tRNA-synthetase-like protein
MTMKLIIAPEARELGIVHPVAAVMTDLVVLSPSPPHLIAEGEAALAMARENLDAYVSRPEVRGFRELFADLGYPHLEPAGERLVRLFSQRGLKSINSLVDAYNICALESASGLGMHDTSGREGDIRVYRATGAETIVPMFKEKPEPVTRGDLVYASGTDLMAWLGRRDVDSDRFKVTPSTTSIAFIVLGNKRTSRDHNEAILAKCFERIRSCAPSATMTRLETQVEP